MLRISLSCNEWSGILTRMCDRFFGEQEVFELLGEYWVFAPNPLQQHGCMLLFLVSIMLKDCLELRVLAYISSLIVPINGFQFLHQGHYCLVHVARFIG